MQSLIRSILAILAQSLTYAKRHARLVVTRDLEIADRPHYFRSRPGLRFTGAQQLIRLRLVSDGSRGSLGRVKVGPFLGASLGTVVIAGFVTSPMAQSPSEEACAFVLELRSPYTVERILEEFPNDPCVPIMLAALSPQLLAKISPALIAALPRSQLRLVPKEVLDQLGLSNRNLPGIGPRRSVGTSQY